MTLYFFKDDINYIDLGLNYSKCEIWLQLHRRRLYINKKLITFVSHVFLNILLYWKWNSFILTEETIELNTFKTSKTIFCRNFVWNSNLWRHQATSNCRLIVLVKIARKSSNEWRKTWLFLKERKKNRLFAQLQEIVGKKKNSNKWNVITTQKGQYSAKMP